MDIKYVLSYGIWNSQQSAKLSSESNLISFITYVCLRGTVALEYRTCVAFLAPLDAVCVQQVTHSLYVHINIHIHTYTHIYTYTHTHIHIHAYIHTYMHTYIYTYTHTHIHTYTHTSAVSVEQVTLYLHRMCVCVCVCVCTSGDAGIHTHTHITHTHTHTHQVTLVTQASMDRLPKLKAQALGSNSQKSASNETCYMN